MSVLPSSCILRCVHWPGADPSTICGESINSEEDVLHVKDLPTFDGKLSQSSTELLISFLTVPYIRIPLVINFFASPENINALSHPDMQRLLDSVMFEPGLWQPLGNIKIPQVLLSSAVAAFPCSPPPPPPRSLAFSFPYALSLSSTEFSA